jgi:chemotaxis protein methyltransferase CheR
MEMNQYTQVKSQIWRLLRIDLSQYKSEQMCRRLDSWLVRSSTTTWDDYFRQVQEDPKELRRFRDYLTINVSEFFRDADRWQNLKDQVLPELLKEAQRLRPGRGGLKIWSAGCSTGQEPYTLAMLLDEIAPGQNHQVMATDLDRGALQKAMARGPYSLDDVRNVSAERRAKYFETGGPPFFVKEKTGRVIKFRELNLLLDSFDTNFDLIVCRNVIIYFTAEAKSELYKRFQAALRPGGVLFIGGTEVIPRPTEIGLHSQGISLYARTKDG